MQQTGHHLVTDWPDSLAVSGTERASGPRDCRYFTRSVKVRFGDVHVLNEAARLIHRDDRHRVATWWAVMEVADTQSSNTIYNSEAQSTGCGQSLPSDEDGWNDPVT